MKTCPTTKKPCHYLLCINSKDCIRKAALKGPVFDRGDRPEPSTPGALAATEHSTTKVEKKARKKK